MKKIALPESQLQEVLFELINRMSIDRRTMMLSSGVLNLPARINDLRNKGVEIQSVSVITTNRYGREVSYVNYSLLNKRAAISAYERLKQNQSIR